MRTLLITADFPPKQGGAARYYSKLFKSFPRGSLMILAEEDKKSDSFDAGYPHPIIRKHFFTASPKLFPRWMSLFWFLDRIIRKYDIERICVGQVLPIGHVARIVKNFYGIPYYVFVHGMDIAQEMNLRRKMSIKGILKNADGIITNSEFTKNLLCQYNVPLEKTCVITPCPGIAPPLNPPPSKGGNGEVILTVGRLVKRKGIDNLIKAFSELEHDDAILQIAGSGPEKENLEQLTRDLGIQDRVCFFDDPSDEKLSVLYAGCDIFALPARGIRGDIEGYGIVCLEANSFGKPVVASRAGGLTEAVINEETGLLVDPENIEDIARASKRLLDNPELRERLGLAGKARAEKDFKWEDRTKQLQEFL